MEVEKGSKRNHEEEDPADCKKARTEDDDESLVQRKKQFFEQLQLASHEPLRQAGGRTKCSVCQQSRKFFCYSCFQVVGDPTGIPRLSLPIKVDIVHHPTEKLSKSSATHAKVLAPDDVTFLDYPADIPDYDLESTVLLFPCDDAVSFSEIDASKIKRCVFVDSTWSQTKQIVQHPKMHRLRRVKIDSRKTTFWRFQRLSDEYLSTLEAIYFAVVEYITATKGRYEHEVDNLLYYYTFLHGVIQDFYKANRHKSFVHINNYIDYNPLEGKGEQASESTVESTQDTSDTNNTNRSES
eukprot:GILK01009193.1.p1 GENE.GILK01009193.1~~GILK01009193.1.p1  ORF type:complete len:296 (+),score=62.80 GILK01009193.1:23-910(+)